jgi:hypothetical protein
MNLYVATATALRASRNTYLPVSLHDRRQSAILHDMDADLACWSRGVSPSLDPDTARKKQDEVKTRSSQDDEIISRTDGRFYALGRGLTCPELLDCSSRHPLIAKGLVSRRRLPMKHGVSVMSLTFMLDLQPPSWLASCLTTFLDIRVGRRNCDGPHE